MVSDVIVTDDRRGAAARRAADVNARPEEMLESPHLLVGTIDERLREVWSADDNASGVFMASEIEGNMEKLAPGVSRLVGG